MSIETSQTEMQRENRMKKKKKWNSISKDWDNDRKCSIHVMELPEGEEKGAEEIFEI